METKNYLIRESAFDDYAYFAKWEVDPAVTEFLSYDEGRTYEDVVEEAYANKADDTKIDYTIVDKNTGSPIGRVYLSRIDRHSDSLDITKLYIGDADYKAGVSPVKSWKRCSFTVSRLCTWRGSLWITITGIRERHLSMRNWDSRAKAWPGTPQKRMESITI